MSKNKALKIIIYILIILIIILTINFFLHQSNKSAYTKNNIILSNNEIKLYPEDSYKLDATFNGADNDDQKLIYEIEDESIATIDNETGFIYANKTGVTKVKIFLVSNPEIYKECIVKVVAKTDEIILNEKSITLEVSESKVINISTGTINSNDIKWEIEDNTIATVDSSGLVFGLKEGKTYVNVKYNGKVYGKCEIEVIKSNEEEKQDDADSEFKLNKAITTINVGKNERIYISTNKDEKVTWESSDPTVATVDSNGNIKGISEGNAIITAIHEDQNVSIDVVIVKPKIKVSSISLNREKLEINIGDTESVVETINPNDATNKAVTWSSSNEKVAIVDSNGNITGVGEGNATITVKTNDEDKKANVKVTVVKQKISVESISLNKANTTLNLNSTEKIISVINPENATNKAVTWSSSNEKVAIVDSNGNVTGIKEGNATITVKTNDGDKTASINVSVVKPLVSVTSISLDKSSIKLDVGSTQYVTATISPENATNKSITWSSSNEEVAIVDSNGNIMGVGEGNAIVIAKTNDGNKSASVKVNVINPVINVSNINLNKENTTLNINGIETLIATISPENATDKSITWSSSNEEVAIVDENGIVKGLKTGTTTITAKSNNSNKAAICIVTVVKPTVSVTGVSLNKTSITIDVGKTETLLATVSPNNATNKSVVWTSSNTSIATVDENGIVKGVKAGNVDITVKTNDGNKIAVAKVLVVNPIISVTEVNLNKTSTTINVNGTETLIATVSPNNATNKGVTWTSSNTSVATVDSNGNVTGIKAGNANITVKTNDGNKTAVASVLVVNPTINVTGVSLNKTSTTLNVNGTETLTATVSPNNATNKAVTWSSSNTSIATVSSSGVVTGVSGGTAIITVKTSDGEKTATCTVTVKVPVTGVSLNKTSTTLNVNGTETLTATVSPSNATNKAVTWKSSNTSVATVDSNGKVTAKASGTAIITVKTSDGEKTATCTVTVKVPVTGVSLNKTSTTLNVNGTETLTATVSPSNATNKGVTWKSSNTSVATVDSNGKVTAKAAGTATITVTTSDGSKTATCTVTVKVPVTGVSLNKTSTTLNVNGTETLTATVSPSNATNKAVTWKSSNTSVATVDSNGKVTAKAAGTATITVTTSDGSKTATCTVTVKVPVTGVSLNKTSTAIDVGNTETLTATVSPSNATNKTVTWKSSNTSVATVDSNGKVTAKAVGTATITVTTSDGSKTATCTVKVTQAKIHFISVGSSDSILIQSEGKYALVDTSNDYDSGTPCGKGVTTSPHSVEHVKTYLKNIGVSHLDYIIATHSHCDHIGGVPVIVNNFANSSTKYYYRTYVETGDPKGSISSNPDTFDNMGYYNKAITALNNKSVQLVEVTSKYPTITLGKFSIKLLNTEPVSDNELVKGIASGENKNSIVQYITYNGKFKTLLASDMEYSDETKVANSVGDIEILKIGHHSYDTSTSKAFVNVLKPERLVITNSKNYQTSITDYMQSTFGTKVYLTGNVADAIVFNFTNSGYTVTPSNSESVKSNGWSQENGAWYYYEDSVRVKGWKQIVYDNIESWFYFDSTGKMVKGWKQIVYDNTTSWFYFNDSGVMLTGWQQLAKNGTTSWFYFNDSGVMLTGWQKISYNNTTSWFYFDSEGRMYASKCYTIDGTQYCFDDSGICISNGC